MSADCNDLTDEEFRHQFRSWVEANCPQRLRNMRKQRPLFDEVADWYRALANKGSRVCREAVKDRQREGGRLAGARLRLAEQILAGE